MSLFDEIKISLPHTQQDGYIRTVTENKGVYITLLNYY